MPLAKILIYLVSSIFMFFAGNMQNWLTPWLEDHGVAMWIVKSPAPVSFLFVFATLINMWFVGKFTPKDQNKLTEEEKKKIIKREGGKHKKAITSLNAEHKKEVVIQCDAVRTTFKGEITSLNDECSRKQITIDVLSAELAKARQEQNNTLQANVKRPLNHHHDAEINSQPQFADMFTTIKDNK